MPTRIATRDSVAEARLDAAIVRKRDDKEEISIVVAGATYTGEYALTAMQNLAARSKEGKRIVCTALGAKGYTLDYDRTGG